MQQDYFFQSSTGWNIGWYGYNQYHFDTYEEAELFARYWNVRVPSTSSRG